MIGWISWLRWKNNIHFLQALSVGLDQLNWSIQISNYQILLPRFNVELIFDQFKQSSMQITSDGPADLSLRGLKSSDVSSDSDCSESLHEDDEVDVMSDDTWTNEPKTWISDPRAQFSSRSGLTAACSIETR